MDTYDDLLRVAIRESEGDSPSAIIARANLLSLIAQDPHGLRIFEEETGPEQAAVEIHLEEGTIVGHVGPADPVVRFIGNVARAAGAVAKQRAGKNRYKNRILLEGIAPGSLKITLRAPEPTPETLQSAPLDGLVVSSAESESLRLIASVFRSAEVSVEDPDLSNLSGVVSTLPATARAALKAATKVAGNQRWTIAGSIAQRHHARELFRLNQQAIGQLMTSLETKESEPDRREATGYLDGFKYTLSQLFFRESGAQSSYPVAVVDEALMLEVARLAAEQDRKFRVGIDFFTSGDADGRVVHGRVLAWIQPLEHETVTEEMLPSPE